MFVVILIFLNIGYCIEKKGDTGIVTKTEDMPVIALERAAQGLKKPTHITGMSGDERLFVTEQEGRVRIVKAKVLLDAPFLDIASRVSCCGERGLLSIAFPPGYEKKKYFYVNYTDKNGNTVVTRYRTSANPDVADPKSEEVLLRVDQPYANHNGGQLAFGPDGFLYIGIGDGGSGGDPHGYAQKGNTLLGKILRIDVESGKTPYTVPQANPFTAMKNYRPEIWALGLRNPWRFSFDRTTGDLFIADVGQNRYEEIDFQPASGKGGENYGWNVMEGNHCYTEKACDRTGLTMPVVEYGHSDGCSVTGGYVYRGKEYPALEGIYFYGDFCSGRIWGLSKKKDGWENSMLVHTDHSISTFGEDGKGSIYAADYKKGEVYEVVPRSAPNK